MRLSSELKALFDGAVATAFKVPEGAIRTERGWWEFPYKGKNLEVFFSPIPVEGKLRGEPRAFVFTTDGTVRSSRVAPDSVFQEFGIKPFILEQGVVSLPVPAWVYDNEPLYLLEEEARSMWDSYTRLSPV